MNKQIQLLPIFIMLFLYIPSNNVFSCSAFLMKGENYSDKEGNTAAIELIDGKFSVCSGKTMPIPVLCNEKYQEI